MNQVGRGPGHRSVGADRSARARRGAHPARRAATREDRSARSVPERFRAGTGSSGQSGASYGGALVAPASIPVNHVQRGRGVSAKARRATHPRGRGSWLTLLAVLSISVVLAYGIWHEPPRRSRPAEREVVVPELSPQARAGELAYVERCAQCHGPSGAGSTSGPALVDSVYRSGHHADSAFMLAVRRGVRAHHWLFGDMPPQPGMTDRELADIVRSTEAACSGSWGFDHGEGPLSGLRGTADPAGRGQGGRKRRRRRSCGVIAGSASA
ncbi:MAG: c-type cytochrome [Candidatus Rokuibacteriota bacterium]